MKVVFTGGHHSSAIIVAKKLKEKGNNIFWFGHKQTMIGDKNPSSEYLEVTKEKIPFFNIKAGKLQRNFKFVENLIRIPVGFFQSFYYLNKIKPDIIVTFGGYLGLPVAWSGFLLGIPVVAHEQTVISGKANTLIALVASKIFISFPSSANLFPKEKVIFSGLPVREEIFKKQDCFIDSNHKNKDKRKIIYFTGGKQGSHIINEAVFSILPVLLEKFIVIHQCGSNSIFNDIRKAQQIKDNLGRLSQYYFVKEYFFDDEIGGVYSCADFFVSRAGAHTVYELILLKKPAILIPIPWSSRDEQSKNGKMLEGLGLAKILTQEELAEGKLYETIESFSSHLSDFTLKDKNFSRPSDPTKIIIEEIEKIVSQRKSR